MLVRIFIQRSPFHLATSLVYEQRKRLRITSLLVLNAQFVNAIIVDFSVFFVFHCNVSDYIVTMLTCL